MMDIAHDKAPRRRCGRAKRALRTLVPSSFDVYWETDAQHRFTLQEFSEHLADAQAGGSDIGKTRWEMASLWADAVRVP